MILRRIGWNRAAISCLLVAAAWAARAGEGGKDAAPPATEGEAVNGLAISLEIKPVKWAAKAQIEFVCTVRNVSDEPIRLAAWGLMDVSHALEITNAAGKTLPIDGGRNRTAPATADMFPVIKPKETRQFTLKGRVTEKNMLIVGELQGGIWHWTLADGVYTVRAVLNADPDNDTLQRHAKTHGKLWTGRARSKDVKIAFAQTRGEL
jgi:hypothetical protein